MRDCKGELTCLQVVKNTPQKKLEKMKARIYLKVWEVRINFEISI
jgi:hypothetical protein